MTTVFAIYVDEYGETGGDLANPQQPIQLHLAALVPAGPAHAQMEARFRHVAAQMAQQLALQGPAPLHAVDLYQRKGPLRRLEVQEALDWFDEMLQISHQAVVGWVAVYLHKADLHGQLEGMEKGERGRRLREALLTLLLREVNRKLKTLSSYGFLFVEAQGAPKEQGLLRRVLAEVGDEPGRFQGVPALADKSYPPLASADFPAYVLGDQLRQDVGLKQERPRMKAWFQGMVQPKLEARKVTAAEVLPLIQTY